MKLVKQTGKGCQYQLSPQEAQSLRFLVNQFPIAALSMVKISKTDPGMVEREKLLNESLATHREELKHKAETLVAPGKFKKSGNDHLFRTNHEERETLLQILNDIRVESWRALGEPENLERPTPDLPKDKLKYYHCMHLAGYFEYHFLNLDEQPGEN
jgi:hypothetical protein